MRWSLISDEVDEHGGTSIDRISGLARGVSEVLGWQGVVSAICHRVSVNEKEPLHIICVEILRTTRLATHVGILGVLHRDNDEGR